MQNFRVLKRFRNASNFRAWNIMKNCDQLYKWIFYTVTFSSGFCCWFFSHFLIVLCSPWWIVNLQKRKHIVVEHLTVQFAQSIIKIMFTCLSWSKWFAIDCKRRSEAGEKRVREQNCFSISTSSVRPKNEIYTIYIFILYWIECRVQPAHHHHRPSTEIKVDRHFISYTI